MTIGMITRAQTFVQEDALVENSSAVFEVLAAVLAAVMFLAAPRLIDRLLAVAVGAAGLATMSMEVSLTERTIGAGFIDGMYIDAPHDFVTLALVWATEGGWRTLAGLAATIGGIAGLVAAGRWARGHLGPDWPAVRRHPTVLLLAIAFALFVTATVLDSSREMFSFPRYYGLVLIEETMELCAGLGVLFAAIALGHPVAEPVPVAAQRRTPVAVALCRPCVQMRPPAGVSRRPRPDGWRMSQRRTLSFLMSLLSAAVVAGLAAVSTAQADTIHVEPDRIASRTAAFELGGIDSARIVSAELLTSRGTKAVPVATVRRATAGDDRLRVRPPRAWRVSKRYDKRLVLRIVTRSSRPVHRFRPEATTRRSATFFVRPLREETITSVELVGDDARREVPVQRVASGTRGGNVRVTFPRAWDRQDRKDTELHVVVDQPPASPPPSSSGDGCDYDLREAGGPDRPPACWRPYADSSPFNRPIPASPPLMAESAAMVQTMMGFGRMQHLEAGNGRGSTDGNRPVYFSRPSDPVFTITCTRSVDWGRCPVEGHQVRIPEEARPAGNSDAHLAVIDPQTGIEVDLWQLQDKPSGGGKLVVSWGDRLSVHGDGVGSTATGAGVAVHAGLIRAEELAAGRIDHALAMAIDCTNGSHVYPAIKVDSECDSGTAPPMGARLQLDLSEAEVDALDVPGWKTTILHALRRYGAYVIDSGGTSAILMESEQGHSAFGEANPLVDFFKANGADFWDPTRRWTLDLDSDVDWERDLQVLDPCVAQGSCG